MIARVFDNLTRKEAVTFLFLLILLTGCQSHKTVVGPSITFTRVPQAALDNPGRLDIIQGRVEGARPGQQIVLYVKTGAWWVQPLSSAPFTRLQTDSSWINSTHLGSEYAALLVEPGYRPPQRMDSLPTPGNEVAAVATAPGDTSASPISPGLQFSGYDWRIRTAPSSRGDRANPYSAANAWTDTGGALHLRIAKESDQWTCAEVTLTRNLGYGLYSFVVRDTSNLPPSVAFSMFTYDYAGGDQNNREMAIEVSRWNDPASKNAQYVVQPFYVAANVARFAVPAGVVTHSFRWEPGKISFKTLRGSAAAPDAAVLSEHVFTSGVPSPGMESVRMTLYIFGKADNPSQNGAEVVIDKFEYLP